MSAKTRKRSSILKRPSLADDSVLTPTSPTKSNKKTTFSAKNSVKEFRSDEHLKSVWIWGASYEESAKSTTASDASDSNSTEASTGPNKENIQSDATFLGLTVDTIPEEIIADSLNFTVDEKSFYYKHAFKSPARKTSRPPQVPEAEPPSNKVVIRALIDGTADMSLEDTGPREKESAQKERRRSPRLLELEQAKQNEVGVEGKLNETAEMSVEKINTTKSPVSKIPRWVQSPAKKKARQTINEPAEMELNSTFPMNGGVSGPEKENLKPVCKVPERLTSYLPRDMEMDKENVPMTSLLPQEMDIEKENQPAFKVPEVRMTSHLPKEMEMDKENISALFGLSKTTCNFEDMDFDSVINENVRVSLQASPSFEEKLSSFQIRIEPEYLRPTEMNISGEEAVKLPKRSFGASKSRETICATEDLSLESSNEGFSRSSGISTAKKRQNMDDSAVFKVPVLKRSQTRQSVCTPQDLSLDMSTNVQVEVGTTFDSQVMNESTTQATLEPFKVPAMKKNHARQTICMPQDLSLETSSEAPVEIFAPKGRQTTFEPQAMDESAKLSSLRVEEVPLRMSSDMEVTLNCSPATPPKRVTEIDLTLDTPQASQNGGTGDIEEVDLTQDTPLKEKADRAVVLGSPINLTLESPFVQEKSVRVSADMEISLTCPPEARKVQTNTRRTIIVNESINEGNSPVTAGLSCKVTLNLNGTPKKAPQVHLKAQPVHQIQTQVMIQEDMDVTSAGSEIEPLNSRRKTTIAIEAMDETAPVNDTFEVPEEAALGPKSPENIIVEVEDMNGTFTKDSEPQANEFPEAPEKEVFKDPEIRLETFTNAPEVEPFKIPEVRRETFTKASEVEPKEVPEIRRETFLIAPEIKVKDIPGIRRETFTKASEVEAKEVPGIRQETFLISPTAEAEKIPLPLLKTTRRSVYESADMNLSLTPQPTAPKVRKLGTPNPNELEFSNISISDSPSRVPKEVAKVPTPDDVRRQGQSFFGAERSVRANLHFERDQEVSSLEKTSPPLTLNTSLPLQQDRDITFQNCSFDNLTFGNVSVESRPRRQSTLRNSLLGRRSSIWEACLNCSLLEDTVVPSLQSSLSLGDPYCEEVRQRIQRGQPVFVYCDSCACKASVPFDQADTKVEALLDFEALDKVRSRKPERSLEQVLRNHGKWMQEQVTIPEVPSAQALYENWVARSEEKERNLNPEIPVYIPAPYPQNKTELFLIQNRLESENLPWFVKRSIFFISDGQFHLQHRELRFALLFFQIHKDFIRPQTTDPTPIVEINLIFNHLQPPMTTFSKAVYREFLRHFTFKQSLHFMCHSTLELFPFLTRMDQSFAEILSGVKQVFNALARHAFFAFFEGERLTATKTIFRKRAVKIRLDLSDVEHLSPIHISISPYVNLSEKLSDKKLTGVPLLEYFLDNTDSLLRDD